MFYLGQRRPAVIWPISSDVQPVSTRIEENLRLQEDKQANPKRVVQEKNFEVNCAPKTLNILTS